MVWFKVDDTFYSHPKVVAIPRSIRPVAIGTWTICGTWSADHELDGYVPAHMVDELGGTIEAAEALVAVKLWKRRREGFVFVNWSKYQPTRAQNDEHRAAERDRKAAYRERQKAQDHAGKSRHVPAGQSRVPNTPIRSDPDPSRPDEDHSSRGKSRAVIHSEDDPVSNSLVSKVVDVVGQHGITIHPLVVPDLIEFIEQRRGPRAKAIQVVDRYFPDAIARSWPEVEQFIHTKGLAS